MITKICHNKRMRRLQFFSVLYFLFSISCFPWSLAMAQGFSLTKEAKAGTNASLFLDPSAGSFAVNSTFTVSIFVNTNGQPINAVEADLKFPPDKLQVVSPTTDTSFFKVWLGVPFYSNTEGTINLKGGIPSPGIVTTKGLITTVTFRVKSTGQASVVFTDESKVLADDGKATDILANKSGAVLNLILPPPAGPNISSISHTDQAQWYANDKPIFIWNKDVGVTGFSYVLNKDSVDLPDDIVDSSNLRVKYENIEDGIWFFHLKAYSTGSGWGGVSHYQILIDKTAPAKFPIRIEPRARTTVRRPFVVFSTTDNTSGIDHYETKILRTDTVPVNEDTRVDSQVKTPFFIESDSPHQTPQLDFGKYKVLVRSYDKAGNFIESETSLNIVHFVLLDMDEWGFGFKGFLFVPWWLFWSLMLVLISFLLWLARHFWRSHTSVKTKLALGVWNLEHKVANDFRRLKEMQGRYKH